MSTAEFYTLTPREVNMVIEARAQEKIRDIKTLVWLNSFLERSKELPEYDEFLGEKKQRDIKAEREYLMKKFGLEGTP